MLNSRGRDNTAPGSPVAVWPAGLAKTRGPSAAAGQRADALPAALCQGDRPWAAWQSLCRECWWRYTWNISDHRYTTPRLSFCGCFIQLCLLQLEDLSFTWLLQLLLEQSWPPERVWEEVPRPYNDTSYLQILQYYRWVSLTRSSGWIGCRGTERWLIIGRRLTFALDGRWR